MTFGIEAGALNDALDARNARTGHATIEAATAAVVAVSSLDAATMEATHTLAYQAKDDTVRLYHSLDDSDADIDGQNAVAVIYQS